MSRHLSRITQTVLILILCLGGSNAAGAQPAPREFNRIASVVEDAGGKFVVLKTSLSRPLPPPNITYLPGGDGETILVADFAGIAMKGESRTFSPPIDGLPEVHIGQFQDNPPILRIAFTATRPALLRRVSFHAGTGSLVISLPHAANSPVAASPPARSALSAGIPSTPQSRPPDPYPPARTVGDPMPPSRSTRPAYRPAEAQAAQPTGAAPAPTLAMTTHPAVSLPERPAASRRSATTDRLEAAPLAPTRNSRSRLAERNPSMTGERQTSSRSADPNNSFRATATPAVLPPRPPEATPGSICNPILPAPARLAAQTFTIQGPPTAQLRGPIAEQAAGPEVAPAPDPVGAGIAALPLSLAVPPASRADSLSRQLSAGKQSQAQQAQLLPPPALPIAPPAPAEPRIERLADTGMEIAGSGPVKITVNGAVPFTYKSFRLHEPERHVIDIQGLPELVGITAPEPQPNPYVTKVRIGNPDGDPSTVRVVLDLASSEVDVKETSAQGQQLLAVIIDKGGTVIEDVRVPAGATVVLDAGHGGSDPGAQRGDVKEKELTLAITEKLRKALEANSVRVTMTRSEDTFVSLADRVTLTNGTNPNAFVSVHINSLETNSSINGIETYYQTEQSKELARSIHDCLVSKLSAPDRSIRRARFYVINHTPVPAVLAEVGFISNKDERDKLISSDYQQEVANAVARGVMLYLSRRSELSQATQGQDRGAGGRSDAPPPKAPEVKSQSLAEAHSASSRPAKP